MMNLREQLKTRAEQAVRPFEINGLTDVYIKPVTVAVADILQGIYTSDDTKPKTSDVIPVIAALLCDSDGNSVFDPENSEDLRFLEDTLTTEDVVRFISYINASSTAKNSQSESEQSAD